MTLVVYQFTLHLRVLWLMHYAYAIGWVTGLFGAPVRTKKCIRSFHSILYKHLTVTLI